MKLYILKQLCKAEYVPNVKHFLRGDGLDCLLSLISIKMEHPRPLQVCTNLCFIFAHTGAGVIRVNKVRKFSGNSFLYLS